MKCTVSFFLTDSAIDEFGIAPDRLDDPETNRLIYTFSISDDHEDEDEIRDHALSVANEYLESEFSGINQSHIAAPVGIAFH